MTWVSFRYLSLTDTVDGYYHLQRLGKFSHTNKSTFIVQVLSLRHYCRMAFHLDRPRSFSRDLRFLFYDMV